MILLGAALGVFFCGNSSEKIAKNSDCLEFGENPGKNFGENGVFEGKTTELFPKNAKTAPFFNGQFTMDNAEYRIQNTEY
ncbi:MAG: hypothetical protein ACRC37_01315 [Lentisphaeria bacterium]